MAEGFDVAEALRCARADGALLRFVEQFAKAFARPIADGDGVDASEMRDAEERLGVRVPAALREAYLTFGRRADLTCSQDPLLPPARLRLDPSGTALVFRTENQACTAWGVPLDALDQDDPPVLVDLDVDRGGNWSPFLGRVSLAVVELVLSETTLGREYESLLNMCEAPEDQVSKILAGYSRVDLPDYPNWAWKDYMPMRWYSAPGRLLRVDDAAEGGSWLIARGQRKRDLKAMVQEIPGRWTFAGGKP